MFHKVTEHQMHWYTNLPIRRRERGEERAPISRRTRMRVWLRDLGYCQYCGTWGGWWVQHLDHVHPWIWGGPNWNNLVVACRPCNMRKSDELWGWQPRPPSVWKRLVDWVLILIWDWPQISDFQ